MKCINVACQRRLLPLLSPRRPPPPPPPLPPSLFATNPTHDPYIFHLCAVLGSGFDTSWGSQTSFFSHLSRDGDYASARSSVSFRPQGRILDLDDLSFDIPSHTMRGSFDGTIGALPSCVFVCVCVFWWAQKGLIPVWLCQ